MINVYKNLVSMKYLERKICYVKEMLILWTTGRLFMPVQCLTKCLQFEGQ